MRTLSSLEGVCGRTLALLTVFTKIYLRVRTNLAIGVEREVIIKIIYAFIYYWRVSASW
jgi:hypothetical protein